MAEDQQTQTDSASAEGGVLPSESTPEGGAASKPRSGFARQKIKIARLTELYENLQNDYEGLLADHDKHRRLQTEHERLKEAFNELDRLVGELRQLKQRAPVKYGTPNLMGV